VKTVCRAEERGDPRQIGDDVFRKAVGEVFLLGIAADIGERQYGDRRLRSRLAREGLVLWGILLRPLDRAGLLPAVAPAVCVPSDCGCLALAPSSDRSTEPYRLGLRRHPELLLQPVGQAFEQLEGLRPLAAIGVHLHQRAAGGLVQRLEGQEASRGGGGPIPPARTEGLHHQFRRGFDRQPAQPLALDQQPVLEGRVADLDAVEEVAAVERDCPFHRLDSRLAQQLLEEPDVDRDAVAIERDRLTIRDQRRRGHGAERSAQAQQGLLKAVARLPVAAVAPEQRCQLLAGERHPGRNSEVSQQGAVLPARQLDALIRAASDAEAAEQRDLQVCHG